MSDDLNETNPGMPPNADTLPAPPYDDIDIAGSIVGRILDAKLTPFLEAQAKRDERMLTMLEKAIEAGVNHNTRVTQLEDDIREIRRWQEDHDKTHRERAI